MHCIFHDYALEKYQKNHLDGCLVKIGASHKVGVSFFWFITPVYADSEMA